MYNCLLLYRYTLKLRFFITILALLMTPIEFLLTRQSCPSLIEPAPSDRQLTQILAAGMRVPDHGGLKPWHFTVIREKGLQRLSELFVESSRHQANANLDKIAKMPFRAPMIIVVSSKIVAHDKVPKQEQLIAAACCTQAMQMAAVALGYGAMWRTGDLAYNIAVKQGLAINAEDEIVGFLYLGSPAREQSIKAAKDFSEQVSYWQ